MSWQAYLDVLHKTGGVDQAAIFSCAGDSVWAVSGGFTATPDEIKSITSGFKEDGSPLFGTGIFVNSHKYMCLEATDRRIYGRKDKEGICFVRTKTAMLVAHHPETVQRGQATAAVEKVADALLAAGY